jgi:hypothetical protein
MKAQKRRLVHQCTCSQCQSHPYSGTAKQHRAINRVVATLDEPTRRRFAGLLAHQWGRGSVQHLHCLTGLSRMTIRRGRSELARVQRLLGGRARQGGGGRKPVEKNSRGC